MMCIRKLQISTSTSRPIYEHAISHFILKLSFQIFFIWGLLFFWGGGWVGDTSNGHLAPNVVTVTCTLTTHSQIHEDNSIQLESTGLTLHLEYIVS